ncbi:hypothetical protein PMSD_11125 [Paenibacillus macquariensis subsp. defensor]|nr:hypothetical protein PMSD_11125 [Paenibacillus macquariensis subsp. defensor]
MKWIKQWRSNLYSNMYKIIIFAPMDCIYLVGFIAHNGVYQQNVYRMQESDMTLKRSNYQSNIRLQ